MVSEHRHHCLLKEGLIHAQSEIGLGVHKQGGTPCSFKLASHNARQQQGGGYGMALLGLDHDC